MDNSRKEEKILLSRTMELADACRTKYMLTHSDFLDLRQRSLVQNQMKTEGGGITSGFYGGWEDAERMIAVFMPDYIPEASPAEHFSAEPEDNPLTVIRMNRKKGSPSLSHRDYLGALMGLGIRREVTGDILVGEDGADVIVLRSMSDYILSTLSQAGRASLQVEEIPMEELRLPETSAKERTVSVASLRLDSLVGAAFGLSRSRSLEAVRSGLIFVNGQEIVKPDTTVEEADKIVMRHKGRVILQSVGGRTGKGRIHVTLKVFR